MKKFLALIVSVLMVGAVCVSSTACGEDAGDGIVIGGSSSISPLMEVLIEDFVAANPEYENKITQTTNDSGTGIAQAKSGAYAIGMASKVVSDDALDSTVICMDGIALVVGKDTELDNVTKEQITGLYLEGTAIGTVTKAITREAGSGTRDAFDKVMGFSGNDNDWFSDKIVSISQNTGAVISGVENKTDVIGYASLGSADKNIANGKNIKKVKYEGVEATEATVLDGTYGISRPFTLVTKKGAELPQIVKDLLAFIASDAGRAIIAEEGYINLAKA